MTVPGQQEKAEWTQFGQRVIRHVTDGTASPTIPRGRPYNASRRSPFPAHHTHETMDWFVDFSASMQCWRSFDQAATPLGDLQD